MERWTESSLVQIMVITWTILLPLQCRRQNIVDQVWIWWSYQSFVVHGNRWIPLAWSFLWRLFIVDLVSPVIVLIWVVPQGIAVSWAPCFEWGKTCFFMIGKNQVSSCLSYYVLIYGQHIHLLSYYDYAVLVSINFGYISTFLRMKLGFLGAVGLGATKFSTIRRDAKNEVVLVIAGVYCCNTVRWVIRIYHVAHL